MNKQPAQQLDQCIEAAKYAQLASIITSKYDATLIFYQIEPVSIPGKKLEFDGVQKEVARVVVPLAAAEEFRDTFNRLFPVKSATKPKKKK